MVVMAQVTVADVATIVALPMVLQPDRAARAVLGAWSSRRRRSWCSAWPG